VSTTVNNDFNALLRAFVAHKVDFLLIGAHALALHGAPRFSEDLDVWVCPTPQNATRVYNALVEFGAPMLDVTEADFARDDIVYQIGVAPIRIDVLTSISGVSFDQAWPNRVAVRYGDTEVSIIGRDDLLANKLATARPKDLADVEALERLNRP
jgi:hypothetical protein